MEELKDFTQLNEVRRAFYDLKKKKRGGGPLLQGSICFLSRFMLERTGKEVEIALSHSA